MLRLVLELGANAGPVSRTVPGSDGSTVTGTDV
jgi:hypothetical protein